MLKWAIIPRYEDTPKPLESHFEIRGIKWTPDRFGYGLYQVAEPQAQVYVGHARRFLYGTNGAARISSPKFLGADGYTA